MVFYERFANAAEAVENHGGKCGTNAASGADGTVCHALSTADKLKSANIEACHACQRDKFLAHAFVEKADPKRLHKMKKELKNDFIKGNPSCKTTVQDSHAFVSNCKISGSNHQKNKKGKDHKGLTFAQQDNNDDNNNGKKTD